MKYRYPDFYYSFECIADRCKHSCCRDWDIYVDEETMDIYRSLPDGEAGKILDNISESTDGCCMNLRSDGRCPFLEESGLCSIILKYGEEYISDICSEHPRFYNYFENTCEMGLGLCCEEVCRLVLEGEVPIEFFEESEEDAGSEEETENEKAVLEFREKCVGLILNASGGEEGNSFERLCEIVCHGDKLPPDDKLRQLALGLECLDENWRLLLANSEIYAAQSFLNPDDMRFIRIFQYLLYRHTAADSSPEELRLTLKFVLCALRLITMAVNGGAELCDAVRMFSSEIEYSDENIGLIKEFLQKCH